jgi:MFS family permease
MQDATNDGTGPGWSVFLWLWASQSISQLGSQVTAFALLLWVAVRLYPDPAQKDELAWALAALSLANMVPVIFGAPVAGSLADRRDRRQIMLACDGISALISFSAIPLFLAGHGGIVMALALTLLTHLSKCFHYAAFESSYALLVPPEQLARANGMMQTTFALAAVLAPGLAALLWSLPTFLSIDVPEANMACVLIVDGLSFLVGAGTLAVLRFRALPGGEAAPGKHRGLAAVLHDAREGARYIAVRRPFVWLLLTFAVANFAAGATVLNPLIVKFRLGGDLAARGLDVEVGLAAVNTAASVGGILGGFAISIWGGLRRQRVLGLLAAMFVMGAGQALFAWSTGLLLAIFAIAVFAAMAPIANAHSHTIWQAQTPPEIQGRVFAIRRLLAQMTAPLSTLSMGALVGLFEPFAIILAVGVALMAWSLVGLFNGGLRRVEDRAWVEEQARLRLGLPAPAELPRDKEQTDDGAAAARAQ